MTSKLSKRQFLQIGAAAGLTSLTSIPRSSAQSTNELKLAFIVGETGFYAPGAAELKRGVGVALDQINAKGLQIGGKTYTITAKYYDDKSDGSTAGRLVEKAVTSDGANMVLASGGSNIVKQNVAVAQRLKFPIMSLWAQVDGVFAGQKGDPYTFSALPPFSSMYTQIISLCDTLDNPKPKKVAIITPNDELGSYAAKSYIPADLKKTSLELVGVEFYPSGTQEYITAFGRIRRLDPDILIINAFTADTSGIVKEMQANAVFPKVIVIESPTGMKESLGDKLTGIFVPILWDRSLKGTQDRFVGGSEDFASRYREKYGKEMPDFTAAIGAHDLITYALVMEKAGVIDDPVKIVDAFRSFEGETFFGRVGFADDGLNRKGVTLAGQFQPDGTKIVYPKNEATANPINPYPGSK